MIKLFLQALISGLKSRQALVAENLALRHQIEVLQRNCSRPGLRWRDRAFWDVLSCLWPDWRRSLYIVQPDTVIRWHRRGFRFYWRWKSRHRWPGRPRVSREVRDLIRQMSTANPPWGAPRIHGELLKLGIDVSQATVSKYMIKPERPPWQNPYVERVIGSIRRECMDHVIIFNERHLRRVLREYLGYYHESRTHLGLEKDCPEPRAVELPTIGPVASKPVLGGLHHRYFRQAA